jgi:hypothetical protein
MDEHSSNWEYKTCLHHTNSSEPKSAKSTGADVCKMKLLHDCPRYFTPKLNKCYEYLHLNSSHSEKIAAFQEHATCMKRTTARVEACRDKLTSQCQGSKFTSMKVIRLSMEVIASLLEKDPQVKVIYLMRDPRGIVSSRHQTHLLAHHSKRSMVTEAQLLCHRMQSDLALLATLKGAYPQNILEVRYEDMAKSPLPFGEQVSQFAFNEPLAENIRKFLHQHTHAEKKNYDFGTMRTNATETADRWRQLINGTELHDMTTWCKKVLTHMGYEL